MTYHSDCIRTTVSFNLMAEFDHCPIFPRSSSSFPQPMNRYFEVNVNFMLCPSEGMKEPFKMLPPWLIWPSYRTVIVTFLFILSFPICYAYIGMSYVIMVLVETVRNIFRIRKTNSDVSIKEFGSSSRLDNRHSLNDKERKSC